MEKLRIKSGGVPAGTYRAKFAGIEATNHAEYGAGLRWDFEVCDGPFTGQKASRITKPSPTLKNSCGKMLTWLAGGTAFKVNDEVDPNDYLGREYLLLVEQTPSGSTRVGTVMPSTVS